MSEASAVQRFWVLIPARHLHLMQDFYARLLGALELCVVPVSV